jgi:NO-binding membrane sensor protein with MHYT domain
MTALAGAVRLFLRHKLLWLINLIGNAAALLALWWWLGLRDETAGQIALSVVAGIVLIVVFSWLHGIALAGFRAPAGIPAFVVISLLRPLLLTQVLLALLH